MEVPRPPPPLPPTSVSAIDRALRWGRGASPAAVESLPDITFDASCPDSECAVCKEQFLDKESLKRLPCSHHYHPACILPWLGITNTCPLCRFQLPMAMDDTDYI